MDIGQMWWPRPFQKNHGAMRGVSERRRLQEQPSVHERGREIRIRLPLHDHAFVDRVVANRETHHVDLEVVARSGKFEQRSVLLRKVDA